MSAPRRNDTRETATRRFACRVVTPRRTGPEPRDVIEERPLRIVVDGEALATLMRTPGSEIQLAVGFLLTEGIVRSRKDIAAVSFCPDGVVGAPGEVLVRLAGPGGPRRRYRDVMSSCSLCGEAWVEALLEGIAPFPARREPTPLRDVLGLRDAMSAAQDLFARTGAAHAAAIAELPFDAVARPPVVREDLGRHNALDKTVGAALEAGMDPGRSLAFLSSRLSFEMVAKAARAGIPRVAGISAPSAAAIRLARRLTMFLAGFVRGETMTVYAGPESAGDPAGDET